MSLNVPESSPATESSPASVNHQQENERKPQGAFSVPLNGKIRTNSFTEKKMEDYDRNMSTVDQNTMYKMADQPDGTDLLCFNIGGKKYFIMRKNFDRFPETRLGLLVRCTNTQDKLKYCDKYFDGEIPEFFFDMSSKGFNDILDVYRLGRLHFNCGGFCPIRMNSIIEYWQIDELLLDPCCALKYYPDIEECSREIEGQIDAEKLLQARIISEDFGPSKLGRLRKTLWNLTEYPETSLAARIYAFSSMTIVIISTIIFVLTTMPELDEFHELDLQDLDNETKLATIQGYQKNEEGILVLKILDHLTMVFFTLEYLIRLACSPHKWKFLKSGLNIVDLMAILPYFLSFLLEGFKDTLVLGRAGKVLRLVRVMRILRVFKLVRHFNGLQSLLSTLGQVYKEITLLMVLICVCVLTFSSLIYFAEKGSNANWTFFKSFWWGLMSITTVGNGEISPNTTIGKMIGGLTTLMGVFILALPVPIILNTFAENYKNRVWKHVVNTKKSERAELEKYVESMNHRDKSDSQNSVMSNQVTPVGDIEEESGRDARRLLSARSEGPRSHARVTYCTLL